MKIKKAKIIVWILFTVYLLILTKVILFKYPLAMVEEILLGDNVPPLNFRLTQSNFIPLKSIWGFLFNGISLRISLINILGNIIAFIPFGFLLPMVTGKINKIKSVIFSSFLLSLSFEIMQLLTGLGEYDVDDILLNVAGGVLGYLLLRNFYYLE